MSKELMFSKLVEFLQSEMNVTEEITLTSKFKDDLSIDSLDTADLIFFVEGELLDDKEIPEKDFDLFVTVEDVLHYVDNQKKVLS
jgi:acyl carrier protein